MPRFFRRFSEGVFDVEDVKARTDELAEFIDAAAAQYHFNRQHLIAVGYSNGANIAASLILLHPHYVRAAVLFRAMLPFKPDIVRNFADLPVFIGAGDRDPIVSRDQPGELAGILASGGADVTISWHHGGHELGRDDVDAAKAWLAANVKKRMAA
jgi:predicted esterase